MLDFELQFLFVRNSNPLQGKNRHYKYKYLNFKTNVYLQSEELQSREQNKKLAKFLDIYFGNDNQTECQIFLLTPYFSFGTVVPHNADKHCLKLNLFR